MVGHGNKPPSRVRLATGYQLYRLNEQGLLGMEIVADAFVPGGPAEGWRGITHAEASRLLGLLVSERWPGLGRWPKAGEAWTVRDGLVVPVRAAADEEPLS